MQKSYKGYRTQFTKLKNPKSRSAASNKWLQRHINDPYVSLAQAEGYRSRAAYKLIEINDKFKIFSSPMKVVDLGAAPGGWSQVAAAILGKDKNRDSAIVALDILEMAPIESVTFLQKDFYDEDSFATIESCLEGKADLVISDMAANTTGHKATDYLRTVALYERAIELACNVLGPGGHFVSKMFQGGGDTELLKILKQRFVKVKNFKPLSSRKESKEVYVVAKSFKG